MRLALIRQEYKPRGPAERFFEVALEALLERNVAISLYTREWPRTRLRLIEPRICNPFYLGALWRDWSFARAVARDLPRAQADIVQSHDCLPTCDIYRPVDGVYATRFEEYQRHASFMQRLPMALSPWQRYTLATERKLFGNPWLRVVLCNSKMVRDDIKTRFGLPDERLPVLYNAVDANVFSPALRQHRERIRQAYAIPNEATTFLLVGSNFLLKGVAEALAAFAELPATTRLVIVGENPRLPAYKRMARELGVRERVVFAGFQPDIAPFYGAADAFLLPAIYDAFSDATMEALASGLPVVTSARSGTAEIVREHDAGFVCDVRDHARFVQYLRALLDPDLRARLGANGRNGVLPLSPAAVALQLVLLYQKLPVARVPRRRKDPARASGSNQASDDAEPVLTRTVLPTHTVLPRASGSPPTNATSRPPSRPRS
jgi:UDP-glucose:(heptosyl)LPS alpha-1,3-glucosyltransferase